ncbi:MAG: hypothetical protein CVV18_04995 [Gammaproteobacteria bacterium HGW-Gammaproteobacteria-8]|nr:MAG: hypothetical protein CVV18_04995 [Gammaproteobacteria bacterium HGW-Gammaproteobacteria-8]
MTAKKLLDELNAAGLTVSTDGLALNVAGPPDKMTPALRRRLMEQKWALIALVANEMPDPEQLLTLCRDAAVGKSVDAEKLADWLIEQRDPGWCTPIAVQRWAEIIHQRGEFPE